VELFIFKLAGSPFFTNEKMMKILHLAGVPLPAQACSSWGRDMDHLISISTKQDACLY
jgi:hypothetical protein